VFVACVVCPFIVSPPYTNKKNSKVNDLEIWRKLFLAARNLHAQGGRNLWHVESN